MTFKNKLWGIVFFLISCNVLYLFFFIHNLEKVGTSFSESSKWFKHAYSIRSASIQIEKYDRAVEDYVISENESTLTEIQKLENSVKDAMDKSLKIATIFSEEEKNEELELRASVFEWVKKNNEAIDLFVLGNHKEASSIYRNQSVSLKKKFSSLMEHRIREEEEGSIFWDEIASKISKEMQEHGIVILSLFSFISILATLLLTYIFTKRLKVLQDGCQHIAKSEFDFRINLDGNDEFSALAKTFNQMAKDLEEKSKAVMESHIKLIQSEKLSAVGQLAAGIAHEVNNPLGIILGFTQSIKSRLESGHPAHKGLEFIEKEANRCKELVQNLLTFSRSNKNEQQTNMEIRSTIDTALMLISAQSKVKNINLTTNYEMDLPKILGNANQIQQVILNLCNNAMDAMNNEGDIEISVGKLKHDDVNGLTIKIKDTGSGMTKEIQNKIFEPFFTTKDVGKGTGLGLSLVHEIVEKHFGTIEVSSEVGHGTTFTIWFPAVKENILLAA